MFTVQQSQSYLNDLMSFDNSSSTEIPNSILEAIATYTDKKKKPKRNRSAFILFSIDIRKKQNIKALDELNPNDKFVKIAQLWKEADEETRQCYEQKAKQEKLKYATELSDFCKSFPTEPIQRPRNYIKKPCNAYGYFLKDLKEEIRKENPEMRMCEVLRVVGEKWKRLGAEDKEKYERQADVSRKNFKEEVVKQMETLKKVKTDSGAALIPQVKSNNIVKQESLVCKDVFVPQFQVEKIIENSSTTLKTLNIEQFEKLGNFSKVPMVLSPPAVQPESFVAAFSASLQAFQQEAARPKANVLENLYWKVEKLRQLILMQLQTMPSQTPLPFMNHNGFQSFNRQQNYMNWEQACTYESPSTEEEDCKKEEFH